MKLDDGTLRSTNQPQERWEESIILDPGGPCDVVAVQVYYGSGTGQDIVYITGDAAEGAIPPTQYCLPYNTIAAETLSVSSQGWVTINLEHHGISRGGFDRIVVQHLVRPGGPLWGMDAGQSDIRSFYFDPTSPNPNFFNIPGIFYRAAGDYMVRLIVRTRKLPRPLPGFVDITRDAKLLTPDQSPLRSDNVTTVDVNNDGWDDIIVGASIYLNKGSLQFEALASPIVGSATVWADVDNDGDMDCFAVNGFGNDKVWRNNGDLTFTDITAATGIVNNAPTVTPLWFDYDRDGRLDLFIANGRTEQSGQEVYFQDKLFRQRANGTFEDVTIPSGIAAAEPAPHFDTWGASLCDANDDGWPDIFVATYRLAPDRLYRNNGDGTFTDVSQQSGVQGMPTDVPNYFGHGMGSDWADIDNDGDVDLAVGNLGHPDSRARYSNPSLIWMNSGTAQPVFAARTASDGGVSFFEMNAGMCFGDFDHDGLQDLWHGQIAYEQRGAGAVRRARIYKNSSGSFTDRTWEWNMDHHGPWTAARSDLDHDGDLDLVCASGTEHVKLYRNDVSTHGLGFIVKLQDTALIGHAYGARVTMWSGGIQQRRWLPGTVSGGRASQMTHDLHFGLGSHLAADSIHVRWPDGNTTAWRQQLAGGSTWHLQRGNNPVQAARHLPEASQPLHGAVGLDTTVTFKWRTTAQAAYIEVLSNSNGATTVRRYGPFAGSQASISLPASGRAAFWRLCNADDTTAWTSLRQFLIGPPLFDNCRIDYPRDGDTGVATHFLARWTAGQPLDPRVSYPIEYQIDVFEASDTTSAIYAVEAIAELRDSVVELQPRTQYILRLRPFAVGVEARGPWITSHFTTYGAPPAPQRLLPADGATGVSIRPAITVQRVSTAEAYVFQIDSQGVFNAPYERERTDSTMTVLPALKAQTTYRWRARVDNRAGRGEWSTIGTFTTGGTVSIRAEDIDPNLIGTAVIADVTGRVVGLCQANELRDRLTSLPTAPYVVQVRRTSGLHVDVYVIVP